MIDPAGDQRGRRSPGLAALCGLFGFGAVAAGLAAVTLLVPGSRLEPIWRLNPAGHAVLSSLGLSAVALMLGVASACALTAVGVWLRARWGHRLAVTMLVANLVGDTVAALLRGELRTLVGVPIGGLLLAWLMSARVRSQFEPTAGRLPPA